MRNLIYIVLIAVIASCASADKDYLITIKTDKGEMKAILFDETPKHKENFIKLAKEGFFDSTLFHRVIKEFMIQGGDPDSKGAPIYKRLGSGGPGYTVPAEFNKDLFHIKGALSAARQPDQVNPNKESSGSQFYIVQGKVWTKNELLVDMNKLGMAAQQMMQKPENDSIKQALFNIYQAEGPQAYGNKLVELKDFIEENMQISLSKEMAPERLEAYTTIGGVPHLDDEYTVFGRVISGLNVLDSIAAVETDPYNRPQKDVMMMVEVEEVSKSKITKMYGYEYPAVEK